MPYRLCSYETRVVKGSNRGVLYINHVNQHISPVILHITLMWTTTWVNILRAYSSHNLCKTSLEIKGSQLCGTLNSWDILCKNKFILLLTEILFSRETTFVSLTIFPTARLAAPVVADLGRRPREQRALRGKMHLTCGMSTNYYFCIVTFGN